MAMAARMGMTIAMNMAQTRCHRLKLMGTPMNTDALITLTQWLSPSFPISAYAYSHGLENAIDEGQISDANGLQIWLEDVLLHGSGYSDAVLLSCAYNAPAEEIGGINDVARAFAASGERLTETVDQGRAFAQTVDQIWETDMGALCYPVAVGRAARLKNLPLEQTVTFYTHSFAASLVSVAVRLIPLGQTEGQAVLAALATSIEQSSAKAINADLNDLTSSCFALDIASMRHETQYSKVFRT